MPFGTQVIGDANDRPTLVAAPKFVGLGVLSTDEYTGAEGAGIDGKDPEYVKNTLFAFTLIYCPTKLTIYP